MPCLGGMLTLSLVSGDGDSGNEFFAIDGNELRTVERFDFETQARYTVRVRVTDAGGLTSEQSFTINITIVDEGP